MPRLLLSAACLLLLATAPARAIVYPVDAALHHAGGGVGVVTMTVTAGEGLRVLTDPGARWQASAALGPSGAEGLPGSPWTFGGLTAPLGALVGEIAGIYRLLGAAFDGPAWASGTLRLFHWDGDAEGNAGRIVATVEAGEAQAAPGVILTPVPLPGALGVLLAGLLALALGRRLTPRGA